MRILDDLERHRLLTPSAAEVLREAHIAYRSATHRLQLQKRPAVVPEALFAEHIQAVTAIYRRLLTH
jgi:glutamate-ammonia-ligase adenylyltransferase